jgi:hypothetical protein
MDQITEIPLYSAEGNAMGVFPLEVISRMHCRIVRNKRKIPKRAILIHRAQAQISPTLTGRVGFAFKQEVPSGFVWALTGTTGSRT